MATLSSRRTGMSRMAAFGGVAALLMGPTAVAGAEEKCKANAKNEFIFKVDFFAGEWGQYTVDGCEGVSPTLDVTRGTEYTLVQKDASNWMHPLGLAYYPDGAHGFSNFTTVPELEEPTPGECDEENFKCNPGKVSQAPLYCINGKCEDYKDWNNGVTSGLDVYEPTFKRPQDQWAEVGGKDMYAVKITIPKESKTKEFFYFCHIHYGMSGRMVVNDPAKVHNDLKFAGTLGSAYYGAAQNETDVECGTFGQGVFHTDKATYCPDQDFLCGPTNTGFGKCLQAVDCAMNYNMRVTEHSSNDLVDFMNQMIPHHQNAVQMARAALKLNTKSKGYDDADTDVPGLLHDIINTQNMQIQSMKGWLDTHAKGEVPERCGPPAFSAAVGASSHPILLLVAAAGLLALV